MDFYQIRYFLAVAETGSFTKAAERVFVTQPTLSAGIKKLEESFGAQLFERRARRVELTEAGRRFHRHARVIFEEWRTAERDMRRGEDRQGFRLGTLRTLPVTRVAGLLAQFAVNRPDVDIDLVDGSVSDLEAGLTAGKIDMAITLIEDESDRDTSFPLFREKYRLAVSDRNPLARRHAIRLPDLDGLPFILRRQCEVVADARRVFLAHGARPRIVYRSTQEEWTTALVAADLGLALMPESYERPGVAFVTIADYEPSRLIGLRWRPDAPAAVASFRTFASSYDWHATPTSDPRMAWMR